MNETAVNPINTKHETGESAEVISIWKNASIAGMSAATAQLNTVFSEDMRAQIAVKYIDDEIDAILDPQSDTENETTDLLDLSVRISALRKYSKSQEYSDLVRAYGPHAVVPNEVDATEYDYLAGAA